MKVQFIVQKYFLRWEIQNTNWDKWFQCIANRRNLKTVIAGNRSGTLNTVLFGILGVMMEIIGFNLV